MQYVLPRFSTSIPSAGAERRAVRRVAAAALESSAVAMLSANPECSWVEITHPYHIFDEDRSIVVGDHRCRVLHWGFHTYFGLTELDAITLQLLGLAKPVGNPYERR